MPALEAIELHLNPRELVRLEDELGRYSGTEYTARGYTAVHDGLFEKGRFEIRSLTDHPDDIKSLFGRISMGSLAFSRLMGVLYGDLGEKKYIQEYIQRFEKGARCTLNAFVIMGVAINPLSLPPLPRFARFTVNSDFTRAIGVNSFREIEEAQSNDIPPLKILSNGIYCQLKTGTSRIF